MKLRIFTSLVVVGLAAPAVAQPAPAPESVLPNIMASMPGGTADIRLDYSNFNGDTLFSDVTFLNLDAHVQYITPAGFGGYLEVPFTYASGNGDSESNIGNLALGGLYAIRNSPETTFLLRGGVAIDTADDDGEVLVPFGHLVPRLGEYVASGAGTTWLRLGGQIRFGPGGSPLRIGGSVNFDIPTDNDGAGFDALVDIAVSLGFVSQSGFGAAFGFIIVQSVGAEGDDENITGLNITVDNPIGPTARLYGAIGVGLEDGIEGFSLGGGVRLGF